MLSNVGKAMWWWVAVRLLLWSFFINNKYRCFIPATKLHPVLPCRGPYFPVWFSLALMRGILRLVANYSHPDVFMLQPNSVFLMPVFLFKQFSHIWCVCFESNVWSDCLVHLRICFEFIHWQKSKTCLLVTPQPICAPKH